MPVMLLDPGVDAGWHVGAPWAGGLGRAVLEVCDGLREGEASGYEGSGEDDGEQMSQVASIWHLDTSAKTCDGVEEEDRAVEEAIAAE